MQLSKRCFRKAFATVLAFAAAVSLEAAASEPAKFLRQNPKLLEQSKRYSDQMIAENPELKIILDRLGFRHLHELSMDSVYSLNLTTGEVTSYRSESQESSASAVPGFSFGTPRVVIGTSADAIIGEASTTVTCLFGGQLAEVHGFMASTVSRDPTFGVRTGILVADNFLTTKAQANFSVLKLPRGARNPANRTVLESTHTGSCGDEIRVVNIVSTWPPLRTELAIDDTGSMGNELAGVKAGLASFIALQSEPDGFQRQVSYELISFKDAPNLRLANTTDANAAIAAVQSLFPSGGGDCPEDAYGALSLAIGRTDEDAEASIVLVTDASPRSGNLDQIISTARNNGIKVHVLLSGDCVASAVSERNASSNAQTHTDIEATAESARSAFSRLAVETGGRYVYLPNATAEQYAKVLMDIFRDTYNGDRTPPTVSVKVSPRTLWPANHRMIPIRIEVAATDDRDPHPVVALESVVSNESDDAQGDGNTTPDIMIDTDGTIRLRAERSGHGAGRTYTITYRAQDASGNVGSGSAEVFVPHSQ
jgi:Mg-chelatase subunit ChlD